MTSPTGRDLGTATGSIIIRVDSLKEAAVVAQTTAKEINAAFASISGGALGNLAKIIQSQAKIASDATAVRVAEVRKEAQEVKSAADIEVAASKARAQADSDATKVLLANQKARQGGGGIGVGAGQGAGRGGGQAGQDYRFPTFIQFAAYPAGQLLSLAGAQGASAGVMGAGALAGLVDQLPLLRFQITTLSARLTDMGGVIGNVARIAGGAVAGGLGEMGASIVSIVAVAAPFVAAAIGISAVMGEMTRRFNEAREAAEQNLAAQEDVTTQVLKGATSADLEPQLRNALLEQMATQGTAGGAQKALDEYKTAFDEAQQYAQLRGRSPIISPEEAAAQARMTAAAPVIQTLTGVNVGVSGFAAVQTEIDVLQEKANALTSIIEQLSDALADGSTSANHYGVVMNDAAAAANASASAAVEDAQMRRQIAQMSTQQLQKRLAENQAEAVSIGQVYQQTSGEQRALFDERLTQLDKERGALQAMLAFGAPLRDLVEFLGKAADLSADFTRKSRRTQEDRAISASDDLFDQITEQAREVEDFVRQRGQAVEDFNRDQSRADEDYLRARQKTRDDYNEAELDAEAEHQDRLAKIIRDARISILEAASRLDARAVFEQQRRRNQAIEDENETATEAREQRLEQFEEALADQEDQYQRQRALRTEDFDRQLQREDLERAIRAARAEQDDALQQHRQARNYALQDARRLEDYQRQINQLASHYSVMQRIQDAGLALLRFSFNYLFGQVASDMTGIGRGGRALPTMDAGGTGVAGQAYWIGRGAQPELFIPSTNGTFIPNAGGGVNLTWTGDLVLGDIGSYSPEIVKDMISDGLDDGLRRFFSEGMAKL